MRWRRGNILLVILAVVGVMAIAVGGYFWWTTQKPKTAVSTPDSKPKEASSSADETANWKTYENTKYKFGFEYPPDFAINQKLENSIEITAKDIESSFPPTIIVVVHQKTTQQSLANWVNNHAPSSNYETVASQQAMKVDGHDLVYLQLSQRGDFTAHEVFIENDLSTIIEIGTSIKPGVNDLNGRLKSVFDQILSTFKFIDQDTYTACGCGCCSGATPQEVCLYKSNGDSLERIKQQDTAAKTSPQCAVIGCSRGTTYKYCD